MPQFDRVCRLLVGKKGTNEGTEVSGLRITFRINKTTSKNPNRGSICVYGLSAKTREEFEKPDTRVVLYAGYEEGDGAQLLFAGSVTFAWTRYEEAEVVTEFELGDGAVEIRDTVVSLGYAEGVETMTVLRDIAKQMGAPLIIPSDAPTRSWSQGLSFYGVARELLDRICRASGLSWSIQNGNLQIIPTGGHTTRQGVVLELEGGLLGYPERQRAGDRETAEVEDVRTRRVKKITSAAIKKEGWKVKALLLPTVSPGDRVILKSRSVEGVFVVDKIDHDGDTEGGDWTSNMLLLDPKLAAAIKKQEEEKAAKRAAAQTRRLAREAAKAEGEVSVGRVR